MLSWGEPVFLRQIWHRHEVIVGREQYEIVTKRDNRDEGINGLQLPTLAPERSLERSGVLRVGFVQDVTGEIGPKPCPFGKIGRRPRE